MNFGIVGYGAYIPHYRIKLEDIANVWGQNPKNIINGLKIEEKSVPAMDEDTVTISVEAAKNAIIRAGINPREIGSIFIGSESHPYAVKPSGTIVCDAINAGPDTLVADFEFACKAGTAAIQCCLGLVKSGMMDYGLAIGADTAQGKPGDALEYSAAAGGAAFIIGKNPSVEISHVFSFTTDTPDFWRREGQQYPKHGARFTGEPAYFKHIISSTEGILKKSGHSPTDFDHVIFHTPNGKFPRQAAKKIGIPEDKLSKSLIVEKIGNAYSGSSILGLTNVLDNCEGGEKILMTSFGSGAGSDSFILDVKDSINEIKNKSKTTQDYIDSKSYVNYATYLKYRKKLRL